MSAVDVAMSVAEVRAKAAAVMGAALGPDGMGSVLDSLSRLERSVADLRGRVISPDDAEWVGEHGGMDGVRDALRNDGSLVGAVIDELWPDGRPDGPLGNEEVLEELRRRLKPASAGLDPKCADGLPARKGETVYHVITRSEFVVVSVFDDGYVSVQEVGCGNYLYSLHADLLTHARPVPPDSWERVEEDVMVDAKDYCESHGIRPKYPKHSGKAKCEDLVRRCKALAGRA